MIKKYNRFSIIKTFSVTEVITSYYFEPYAPESSPYYEKYTFWQIFYVCHGSVDIVIDNNVNTIREGQAVFRKPGSSTCMVYPKTPIHLAVISFECKSPSMKLFGNKILTLYGEEASTLLDLIKTGSKLFVPVELNNSRCGLQLKKNAPPTALQFVGISLERFLIMVYSRLENIPLLTNEQEKVNTHNGESELIIDLKYFMVENIAKNLTIDDMSNHFGINPTTLMKLFKREVGDSIINFFISIKIKEAKNMITSTSMNFTQISEALGFSSVNYFSKLFKKRLGITPTEFSRLKTKRRK